MNARDYSAGGQQTKFVFEDGNWSYEDPTGNRLKIVGLALIPNGDGDVAFFENTQGEVRPGLFSLLSREPMLKLVRKARSDLVCFLLAEPLDTGARSLYIELDEGESDDELKQMIQMMLITGGKTRKPRSDVRYRSKLLQQLLGVP